MIKWADEAWEDYRGWHKHDARLHARINKLIEAVENDSFRGVGKPEPLRHKWTGYWSRRINEEHRLVYKVEKGVLYIAACSGLIKTDTSIGLLLTWRGIAYEQATQALRSRI